MRAGRTLNDANLAKDGEILHTIGVPRDISKSGQKATETKEHRGIPNKVVRSSDGEASSTQYTKQHGPRHRVSNRKAWTELLRRVCSRGIGHYPSQPN